MSNVKCTAYDCVNQKDGICIKKEINIISQWINGIHYVECNDYKFYE